MKKEKGGDSAKPKRTAAERLEALRQKEAALKARIEAIENKAKFQDRKDNARLKIIVGGALLADAALHDDTARFMQALLGRAVVTGRDKDFIKTMLEKRKTKASS